VRINHRVTTPASPQEVWAVLENPSRWPEFDPFVRRVDSARGLVREGQHLMVVARGLPVRVPVDVRLVASGRRLGVTVHTMPGLREQIDHSVRARPRGGTEVRVTSVVEGPLARFALVPLWLSTGMRARMFGWRATREHRRAGGTDARSGAA